MNKVQKAQLEFLERQDVAKYRLSCQYCQLSVYPKNSSDCVDFYEKHQEHPTAVVAR